MTSKRARNTIPPLSTRRWYASGVAVAIYTAVPAVLTGAFALEQAIAAARREQIQLAAVTLGAIALGALGKLVYSAVRDRQESEFASHLDYTACVFTVYLTVFNWKQLRFGDESDRQRLRITIHRVERERSRVVQLIDYVGAPGGPRARVFPIHGGVVGRVVTSDDDVAELHRAADASWEDYVRLLQRDWAMLREQAEAVARDRFDFLAVAIRGDDGGIIAVMYLDSSEPGFFDSPTQEIVVAGCGGVAQYTKFRYGK
jgi:hypothetical protein